MKRRRALSRGWRRRPGRSDEARHPWQSGNDVRSDDHRGKSDPDSGLRVSPSEPPTDPADNSRRQTDGGSPSLECPHRGGRPVEAELLSNAARASRSLRKVAPLMGDHEVAYAVRSATRLRADVLDVKVALVEGPDGLSTDVAATCRSVVDLKAKLRGIGGHPDGVPSQVSHQVRMHETRPLIDPCLGSRRSLRVKRDPGVSLDSRAAGPHRSHVRAPEPSLGSFDER